MTKLRERIDNVDLESLRGFGISALNFFGSQLMRLSNLLEVKKGGEAVVNITVDEIAPNGLGFGGGRISGNPEKNSISQEVLDDAAQEILNPNHYKTVEVYDSGCGDGRPVQSVWAKLKSKKGGKKFDLASDQSKLRPKLFGGDFATMYSILAVATERGRSAKTTQEMDDYAIEVFNQMGWVLGTHNDDHGDGPDDLHGCGAIDNRPRIVANSVKFNDQIQTIAQSNFGVSKDALSAVQQVFNSRLEGDYFTGYDGAGVQGKLEESCDNVVRKVLAGDHQEAFVVINTRKGTTFDQASFRGSLNLKYTNEAPLPQVFVVDIWQAESMIDQLIAKGIVKSESKDAAMAAVVTYTLATAGTLTDGTLPVFLAS